MVSHKNLYDFIANNEMTPENAVLVKKHLIDLEVEAWTRGYMECLRHRKKQLLLSDRRRSKFFKRFLDFLSDKTHGS